MNERTFKAAMAEIQQALETTPDGGVVALSPAAMKVALIPGLIRMGRLSRRRADSLARKMNLMEESNELRGALRKLIKILDAHEIAAPDEIVRLAEKPWFVWMEEG